jgi:hypothetical protein
MELIIGIIVVLVIFFIIGNGNKPSVSATVSVEAIRQEYLELTHFSERAPPAPSSIPFDALPRRIQTESSWIERYSALPDDYQKGAEIKNLFEGKKLYVLELQVEFMKRGLEMSGKKSEETLIPALQRKIELLKSGMSEEEAQKQATEEFVAKRDAATSEQSETKT